MGGPTDGEGPPTDGEGPPTDGEGPPTDGEGPRKEPAPRAPKPLATPLGGDEGKHRAIHNVTATVTLCIARYFGASTPETFVAQQVEKTTINIAGNMGRPLWSV